MKKITKALSLLAVACCMGIASQAIAEDKPTADLTMSASSKYVWRGFELSQDSIVLQPSMTVAYKGFSANLWGNLDTDKFDTDTNKWTETDMTLAYDWTMGPVGLTAGYIYYGLDGTADSQEIFLSAALNTLLSPTLSIYRDYDSFPGWYATLGVSYSVPVKSDLALDLGAQISYLSADDASTYGEVINGAQSTTNAYSALHDGLLTASMTFPINQYVSITPQINYSFPLSGDASDLLEVTSLDYNGTMGSGDDSFVYAGVSASFSF